MHKMRNIFIKVCLKSLIKKYNLMQRCPGILLSDWQELKTYIKSNVSEDIEKDSLLVNVGEIASCTFQKGNWTMCIKVYTHMGNNSSFKHLS